MGGKVKRPEGWEPPMTIEEQAEELRWLMSFGVHPEEIAKQFNRTPMAIRRWAFRWKFMDIAEYYEGYDHFGAAIRYC